MRLFLPLAWALGATIGLAGPTLAPAEAGDDADALAFFEAKVRPVLVRECAECHSAGSKKVGGGLRLDTREGLRTGGDSGPALVPGDPAASLLMDALRHDGLAMPPRGRLPEAVVADFERWIAIGAPDPREGSALPARRGIDIEAGRRFWSYQAPTRHEPPKVADTAWPRTEIDRFILAGLEAKGLRPAPDADRATLARRVYFDLIGLPPSLEELDAFEADPRPDAFEALVDRLLARPEFGERWGRHWLDVARFGESLTLRGLVLKEAWRYRDYVIAAFNADLPFDRFIREQVAGDLLPATDPLDRQSKLVATSFLALGDTNLEEQDKAQLTMDVVDEQVDAIGKAFLGQTIGCARCHDHKFDPIPTRDYYALAGILRNVRTLEHANVSRWIERPLPLSAAAEAEFAAHEAAVAALEARVREARRELASRGQASPEGRGGVIAPADLPGIVVDDAQAQKVGVWKDSRFSGSFIGAGYVHDMDAGKGEKTLTFDPDLPETGVYEVRLAYVPGPSRSAAVPVTVFSAEGERPLTVDMRSPPPIGGRFVSLGRYRFERDGLGFVLISNEGTTGHVVADAVVFVPADRASGPAGHAEGEELRRLEAELAKLRAEGPKRPMALSVVEEPPIAEIRVHVRGSVHTLGEPTPRGVLQAATLGDPPAMPAGESGRRELAAWLASPSNPLTARVFVNRAWHWLFGAGIVRTVDNFGTTGEAPTHPELLDDLAVRFVAGGWSVKALVRQIVLSRAYQVGGAVDPSAREADPDNRLLARSTRRRLDAECLRDAMLAVAGRLRADRGGPGFPATLATDYGFRHLDDRRSVYAPVFRNALPEVFQAFDFADPGTVVGRRDRSTVAPQALFLLNNPFVLEASRHAARRLLADSGLDRDGRITRAYRQALGRSPTEGERAACRRFLADGEPEDAWAALFQALFASADFRCVD